MDSFSVRLQVCNSALTNLNARPIKEFLGSSPGTSEQELCALHYDVAYRTVLGLANWSHALYPVKLTPVNYAAIIPGVKLNGWKYMYEYKRDYIKVLNVYSPIETEQDHYHNINKRTYNQQTFTVQNRIIHSGLSTAPYDLPVILCDIPNAMALIVTAEADISRSSYSFRECVIYKLSSLLALGILGARTSMSLVNQFEERYSNLLREAWIQDLSSHYTPDRRESKLISSRF